MMRTDRRTVLKGAIAAGALVGQSGRALATSPGLVIGDSAIPASRAFVESHPIAAGIDLARDRMRLWAALGALDGTVHVEGLTRWSDWVAVRGALIGRGYRVAEEQRIASTSGATLFRWSMARRA